VVKAMYVSATLGQPVVVADVLAGKYDDTPDIIGG
jgi:hypothetical protein